MEEAQTGLSTTRIHRPAYIHVVSVKISLKSVNLTLFLFYLQKRVMCRQPPAVYGLELNVMNVWKTDHPREMK